MRRSIVPLSLLVAAAAALILGTAGPAGAAHRAPRILCPQSAPLIIPCCPVPTSAGAASPDVTPPCCQATPCCAPSTCCVSGSTAPGCCPSAGCCTPPCSAGSLSIGASPNPSTAGAKVVISGGWVGNTNANNVSGATVVLWREAAGQSSFKQMAQTTTDSAGHYTFTLKRGTVMVDQAWYATSDGVKSATIRQQVNALVGLSASTHSTTVGHAIVLRGHVTPSHAGEVVLVEASRGGAWQVIARPRLDHGSNFATSGHFSRQGAVKLRAVLPADKRNQKSTSPVVTVAVSP